MSIVMTARSTWLLVAMLMATPIGVHAGAIPDPDRYIGQSRLLLLFASGEDDRVLAVQRGTLSADAAGLQDLGVLVIPVIGPNDTLRRRFQVGPEGFTAVLVGKDGGVKLRSRQVLTMAALVATIDAMPMRRAEMRRRGQ